MKKLNLFLFTLLSVLLLHGQQPFTLSYTFDGTMMPTVTQGDVAVNGSEAISGGKTILSTNFDPEESPVAWVGDIKNNNTNFINAFLKMNIYPKVTYGIKIDSIVFRQKMDKTGGAYNFKVGCTLGDARPTDATGTASPTKSFTSTYSDFVYYPNPDQASAQGMDHLSIWIAGRGLNSAISYWYVDEVKICGTYTEVAENPAVINITDNKKQRIRLGVDYVALTWFHSYLKEPLVKYAVDELKSEFGRVQFFNGYQREEGVFDESHYVKTLEAMTESMKINPDFEFLGTPGDIAGAYSAEEKVALWGHVENTPWSPYPLWVQEWDDTGRTKTMEDGTVVPIFDKGAFHQDKLLKYYADQLKFMHSKGFKIKYMDLSNEQTIITPAIAKYVYDNLPAQLAPGVEMPILVAPSTWSVQGGINWLNAVDKSKNENLSFGAVSVHNTGGSGSFEEFGSAAQEMGKEAWNTEMHEWIGTIPYDEIMNSSVFFDHMRGGFSGIFTWLFYGSSGGRPHSMINAHWSNGKIDKTTKYEIFKQVVNNSNGGNYVEISRPYSSTHVSAFEKDGVLSVWMLNKSQRDLTDALFKFENWMIADKSIEVTKWHKDLPIEGEKSSFVNTTGEEFTYDIEGETLCFFKIDTNKGASINNIAPEHIDLRITQDIATGSVLIENKNILEDNKQLSYSVVDAEGRIIERGTLVDNCAQTKNLKSGFYIVSVVSGDTLTNKKVLIK